MLSRIGDAVIRGITGIIAPSQYLEPLKRLQRDVAGAWTGTATRLSLLAALSFVIASVSNAIFPLYIAGIINAADGGTSASARIFTFAALFLMFKALSSVMVDIRWKVINPLLFDLSYRGCSILAGRLATPTGGSSQVAALSAAEVSERVSVLQRMQLGTMSVLYSILSVLFPTALDLIFLCTVIGISMGAGFSLYAALGAAVFLFAAFYKRDVELDRSSHAYQQDLKVFRTYGEYIANTKLVSEMDAGPFMASRVASSIRSSMKAQNSLFGIKTERSLWRTAAMLATYGIVIGVAVAWMLRGEIDAGQLFLATVYLDRILAPLGAASAAITSLQSGLVSVQGGYAAFDKIASADACDTPESTWWGHLTDVRTTDGSVFAARDGFLELGGSAKIRIVGPSGAGKSTLLRHVYALVRRNSGGRRVFYLPSNSEIIDGTVHENIALGDPEASRAAVQPYLDFWSARLNNRAIELDDNVESLSSGERQFIAVIRASIRRPDLLILDEATNAMDVGSEHGVMSKLAADTRQSAWIVVNHRAEVGCSFDRVIEMSKDAPSTLLEADGR